MRVLAPLILILIIALVAVSFYALSLRKCIKASKDPAIGLPRKERREHARKLLAREQLEYDTRRTEELAELLSDQLNRRIVP